MGRNFMVVAASGVLAMLAGLGALWYAASRWTSFDDWWLLAPSIGSIVLIVIVAESVTKRSGGEAAWPLPLAQRMPYLLLCAVLAAVSGYLAYWVVTLCWEPARGDAMTLLFHPDQFVELSSKGSSSGTGPMAHIGIVTVIGFLLPALWMRRSG